MDGMISGALEILVEGPRGLQSMEGDPGPLSPAETPRSPDSFIVRWADITHMTDDHFYLYVSLI